MTKEQFYTYQQQTGRHPARALKADFCPNKLLQISELSDSITVYTKKRNRGDRPEKQRRHLHMKGRIIVSTLLALLLFVSLPMSALAATWDISKGDITVNAESGGQTVRQGGGAAVPDSAPVITGTSKENNVTINAESGQTASVTLSGVNIDVRDKGKAAVSTTGEGNVSIELNGGSTLRSGYEHAGLEKNNGGSLTIADLSLIHI